MWKYELRTVATGHIQSTGNAIDLGAWNGLQALFNDIGERDWEWVGTTTTADGQPVWVFRHEA